MRSEKRTLHIAVVIVTVLCAAVVIAAAALCIAFPNKYSSELCAAADEFGLDRSLVKSVVWAESRFDPNATSSKGAKGLMQLMPETYGACAASLGIDGDLGGAYDPQNSLRCGCYYLALMLDRFDGDVSAALMAYNAGEQNARLFISGEKAVFAETQNYLKKIEFAQKIYGLFG